MNNPEADRRPAHLPPNLLPYWRADAQSLLRVLIVCEADGEPFDGQLQVGCVVRERYQNPGWWGRTLWTVCLAPAQFSCFWADWNLLADKAHRALTDDAAYPDAETAAHAVLTGVDAPLPHATHYFAPGKVKPTWAASMRFLGRIGRHDFYREAAVIR